MKCYSNSDQLRENFRRANEGRRARVEVCCLECGKQWKAKPSQKRKFCSQEHYREYMAKRFDRWIANPEEIALPQAYDEFLIQDELPCLIEGCAWKGQHLGFHINRAHGITAEQFKRAAGFNLGTGLVGKQLRRRLAERPHLYQPKTWLVPGFNGNPHIKDYFSLEAREHGSKGRILAQLHKEAVVKRCSFCNGEFSTSAANSKYCSTTCRSRFYTLDRKRQKSSSCARCKKTFPMTRGQRHSQTKGNLVYCSPRCKGIVNGGRKRKHSPKSEES